MSWAVFGVLRRWGARTAGLCLLACVVAVVMAHPSRASVMDAAPCSAGSVPAGETGVAGATGAEEWASLQSDVAGVSSGQSATFALQMSIGSTDSAGARLALNPGADVTLDLCGFGLSIASPPPGEAAIEVPSNSGLTITDTSAGQSGSLSAEASDLPAPASTGAGAGIGGDGSAGAGNDGGTVTIDGAAVTATGGAGEGGDAGPGAGIGGGGGIGETSPAGGTGSVTVVSGAGSATLAGEVDVPLTVDAGASLTVPATQTLDLDAAATNDGAISVLGDLGGSGSLDNAGTVLPGSGGTLGVPLTGNAYTVSFDSGSYPSLSVDAPTVGASQQSLPEPTAPSGGTFAGWFTEPAGGLPVSDDSTLESPPDGPMSIELFARYDIPQTISFPAPAAPAVVGTTAPLSATGGGSSGEPVIFSVDPSSSPADACSVSEDSSGDWSVSYAQAGSCVIEANQAGTQNGDDVYTAAPQQSQNVTVAPAESLLTFANPAAAVVYGQTDTTTVSVTETDGSAPSGAVQFAIDGTAVGGPVPVSDGSATSPDLTGGGALTAGGHTVSAVFTPAPGSDEPTTSGSTRLVINQARTTSSVSVAPTQLTAVIASVAPGAGVPTGTVTFSLDGHAIGSATLARGTATVNETVPPGESHRVAAVYLGANNFLGSSASTSREDPSITAQLSSPTAPSARGWYRSPVTVTFTCTPNGAPLVGACPAPITLDHSGAAQFLTRTVIATDGGAGTVTVSGIDIDRHAPVLRVLGLVSGARDVDGLPNLRCVAGDAVSGVASYAFSERQSAAAGALLMSTVRYSAVATNGAGVSTRVSGSVHVLGIAISGAAYRDRRFLIRPGRRYTIVIQGGKAAPRYVGATPPPIGLGEVGPRFRSASGDRWVATVQIPAGFFSPDGTRGLGVEIAGRLHVIPVARS